VQKPSALPLAGSGGVLQRQPKSENEAVQTLSALLGSQVEELLSCACPMAADEGAALLWPLATGSHTPAELAKQTPSRRPTDMVTCKANVHISLRRGTRLTHVWHAVLQSCWRGSLHTAVGVGTRFAPNRVDQLSQRALACSQINLPDQRVSSP
jgi:hypothetical protein